MKDETEEIQKRVSPYHHLKKGMPPTIIFHGKDDKTVPIQNVRDLKEKMTQNGDVCDLYEFDGVGHGFFNNPSLQIEEEILAKSEDFIHVRLKVR